MIGPISLWELEQAYKQMIDRELVVFPWRQTGGFIPYNHLAGLITGWIDTLPPFTGKTAYLEHIIIMPNAPDRNAVRRDMPAAIITKLEQAGVDRILMTVNHDHPKRARLVAWAQRLGFTLYSQADGKDWLYLALSDLARQSDGVVCPM